ncbi:MAG: type II toxin-antitoxin system prevent-host-death family antitoxin [Calditrichota bacterium]
MNRIRTSEIRRIFNDVLDRVSKHGERIIVQRRNEDLAAIVPLEDLKLIERIEDEIDVREAKRILADQTAPVPWAEAMAELG